MLGNIFAAFVSMYEVLLQQQCTMQDRDHHFDEAANSLLLVLAKPHSGQAGMTETSLSQSQQ
jgi:hypothetical protein